MTLHYDLFINQGATWAVTFPVIDDNQQPLIVTGWTAMAQVRPKPDEPVLYEWSAANSNIVVSGSSVTLQVAAAVSSAWAWTDAHYDLELIDLGGKVYRLAQGRVCVSQETTYGPDMVMPSPPPPGLPVYLQRTELGTPNGVASLGSDGLLTLAQRPPGSSGVDSVNTRTGAVVLTKTDVGLSSVDNTADSAKPVSTAAATALSGKAATSHAHAEADVTSLVSDLAGKSSTGHSHAGTDVTSGTVAYARLPIGATASTVTAGDDTRLTDARTPTAHSHPESDVTGLVSDLTGKSSIGHSHAESDVTGLVSDLAARVASVTAGDSTVTVAGTATAPTVVVNAIPESKVTGLVTDLAGKAATAHSHVETDVTSLTSDLAGKAATSHTHAGADVTSGTVAYARLPVGATSSTVTAGNDSRLSDARTPTAHSHPESDVTSLTADLAAKVASVTAGDSTITIAGTATAPTVAVNALSESKVTNLVSDLAGKAATSHSHTESDVTSLVSDLAAKATSAALTTETNRAQAAEALLLPLAGGTVSGALAVTGALSQGGFQLPMLSPERMVPFRSATYIQNFQAGHGWTTSGSVGSSNLNDTSTFIRGTQCATVTTAANALQSGIAITAGSARDLTGKMIRLTFQVVDVTHLGTIAFYAGTSSLANYFQWAPHVHGSGVNWVQSGEWVTLTIPWANVKNVAGTCTLSSTGVPNTTTGFTDFRFAVYDDGAAAVTYHLQSMEIVPDTSTTFPTGVVSITFDDTYQSVYDYARPYMDGYGYRGTIYSIVDLLGTSGKFTLPELKTLSQFSGWEVAGHAYTSAAHNAGYDTLTATQVNTEMRSMKAWLVANGFYADSFAYPQGKFSLTTDSVPIDSIAAQYFATSRTIISENAETWPPPMPQRLRAWTGISSATGGTPVSTMTAAGGPLDRCQVNGDWLILCLHQLTTTTPGATTQLLQSDFNTLMDAINSRGIPVLPVGDVVRFYS